jgi:very-short-patch-repair endonuclease
MGNRPARDEARDRWLVGRGVTTLRLPASVVMDHLESVVAHILERCASPLHHPSDGPPPHATQGEDE